MDGNSSTSSCGRKRRISRASQGSKDEQLDSSSTSAEPPQKRLSRRSSQQSATSECAAGAVMDISSPAQELVHQQESVLPPAVDGTTGSDARKTQTIKNAANVEAREDNPEAILGLDHLVLELPQEVQTKDVASEDDDLDQSMGDDSLEEESSDPDDELEEEEEEEEEEGEGGEELEAEDFSSLTIPRPHQAELMNRLINDSLSFSELTALMGGSGDPDADLCPPLDANTSGDQQQLLETETASAPIASAGVSSDATDGGGTSAAASSKQRLSGPAATQTSEVMPVSKKIAVTTPSTASAALVDSDDEEQKKKDMHPAARFEQELCEQQRLQLRRGRGRGRSGRGRGSRLHPTLAALMGQANLCVGHNNVEEAIKMCLEIIRQFPNSPLPYETLAMIYEDRGMQNKSLQFQLMAAFLSPVPDKWIELAEFYKDQDELEQAVYCYSRAIKQSPTTLSIHWSRGELLERMGNPARALKCYTYMLKFLKPKHVEGGLKLAKEIAKIHFSQQNYSGARQALETAFLRYPDHVSHEDINLLLDVLFTIKAYADGLLVLQTYAGVKLVAKDKSSSSEPSAVQFNQLSVSDQLPLSSVCLVPPDLPIDLRSKLTVCLIMNGAFHIAEPLITRLMRESTEEFGDLFIDAAEAFLSAGGGSLALPLLRRLLECPRHGVAATVWRLYAEALVASGGSSDDAVQAYYRVVELAPCNALVRLTLSAMLEEQDLQDAALLVLTQTQQPYDCPVLFRKCELLYRREMHDEFVSTVAMLLGRHCVNIRSRDEAEVLINNKKASNKFEGLRELRRSKGESIEDEEPQYSGEDVPLPDQWSLFVRACSLLYTKKRFAELERLTYSALGSREFMKEHMRDVEFFCLQASMANNDSYFAFNLMRDIVVRHPHNFRVWNLLNQVIIRADDFRHNRFLLRLSQKHPENLALSMLNGHNCLVAGTYKYSLAEYMKVFKGRQTDPLASLMLGLTYIHMACQKFSADKNTLVTQAWVFLNSYRELRGDCQESLYNIGRAMHQLNLLHQAIYYYELALKCPKPVTRPGEPSMDLTKEIAMNLAYLYKKGSPTLARYYIRKYITV